MTTTASVRQTYSITIRSLTLLGTRSRYIPFQLCWGTTLDAGLWSRTPCSWTLLHIVGSCCPLYIMFNSFWATREYWLGLDDAIVTQLSFLYFMYASHCKVFGARTSIFITHLNVSFSQGWAVVVYCTRTWGTCMRMPFHAFDIQWHSLKCGISFLKINVAAINYRLYPERIGDSDRFLTAMYLVNILSLWPYLLGVFVVFWIYVLALSKSLNSLPSSLPWIDRRPGEYFSALRACLRQHGTGFEKMKAGVEDVSL